MDLPPTDALTAAGDAVSYLPVFLRLCNYLFELRPGSSPKASAKVRRLSQTTKLSANFFTEIFNRKHTNNNQTHKHTIPYTQQKIFSENKQKNMGTYSQKEKTGTQTGRTQRKPTTWETRKNTLETTKRRQGKRGCRAKGRDIQNAVRITAGVAQGAKMRRKRKTARFFMAGLPYGARPPSAQTKQATGKQHLTTFYNQLASSCLSEGCNAAKKGLM